jgi:FSR family fosmidomycin resistance protein-like MFS transporter
MQKAVSEPIDHAPVAPAPPAATSARAATATALPVLVALSFCHMLNDMMQSLIPSLYPLIKDEFGLNFTQVGLIALAFQLTASMLQPVVGFVTDKRSMPWSLPIGMAFTLAGLLLLSQAHSYGLVVFAAMMVGVGSAVFHPESSRVARMASGGRYGFAQSLFQVGGNTGGAIGPLLAALIVLPRGQWSIALFSIAALVAMLVLAGVSRWYAANATAARARAAAAKADGLALPRGQVAFAIAILLALMFSKSVYGASLGSYYTFYLIERFGMSVSAAQVLLFVYLAANALGTLLGGPIADRLGTRAVMWVSILGVLPFTLALPHANLPMTILLTIVIGLVMSSAFSAIVVYAQELMPGRVGLVAGIFFGFAFGLGGLGAAGMGRLADATSIEFVYEISAYLPLIGLLIALLPRIDHRVPGVQAKGGRK